jgi:archaemetzincin
MNFDAFTILFATSAAILLPAISQSAENSPERAAKPPGLFALRAAEDKLRPLMARKTPPGPGDWLATHPERGQTFDQYLASNPNRPRGGRTTLYVQPIGEFSATHQRLIDRASELLGIWYGVPVKSLPRLDSASTPKSARRVHPEWGVPQILTRHILNDVLVPRQPKDSVAAIALTTSDLWPGEGWNFVFGEASPTEHVGVWSLARFGDPEKEWPLVLRRTLQVAMHETGHMLGLEHCTQFECGMNGSNSLPESDRAPLPFCSECELKVWWACGLDPVVRTKALLEFFEHNELKAETQEYRRRLVALEANR